MRFNLSQILMICQWIWFIVQPSQYLLTLKLVSDCELWGKMGFKWSTERKRCLKENNELGWSVQSRNNETFSSGVAVNRSCKCLSSCWFLLAEPQLTDSFQWTFELFMRQNHQKAAYVWGGGGFEVKLNHYSSAGCNTASQQMHYGSQSANFLRQPLIFCSQLFVRASSKNTYKEAFLQPSSEAEEEKLEFSRLKLKTGYYDKKITRMLDSRVKEETEACQCLCESEKRFCTHLPIKFLKLSTTFT